MQLILMSMTKVITTKLIHVVLAKSQHQIKFILEIAKNLRMFSQNQLHQQVGTTKNKMCY